MPQQKLAAMKAPGMQRDSLSAWLSVHAWKLPGLTAIVLFSGIIFSAAVSLSLRPTRVYVLPLLADIDAHQPERFILRASFAIATALLLATTTASVLHLWQIYWGGPQQNRLHTSLHHISSLTAHASQLHNGLQTNAEVSRRRATRMSTLQFAIAMCFAVMGGLTIASQSGFLTAIYENLSVGTVRLFAIYAIFTCWVGAATILTWYFLKLQAIPNRTLPPAASPLFNAGESENEGSAAQLPFGFSVPNRARDVLSWIVMNLRLICITGQAVCVIKIFGLWFALQNFSISRRRIIKMALLAALAFAEYTAAFFFAFFLTILAVDIRAKSPSADCASARLEVRESISEHA